MTSSGWGVIGSITSKDFNEMEACEDHNAEGAGNVDSTEVQFLIVACIRLRAGFD